ncbi:MAG: hypothetical protein JO034_06475 [Singulisphaera sp.]|nr:hypothetical protein [Singulisphaera sp.]
MTGEDARNVFNPPALVEVSLTEILSDQEIGAYHFHLGDIRSRGVGTDVSLVGIPRREGAGTVLRFQAPTYAAIYRFWALARESHPTSVGVDEAIFRVLTRPSCTAG